MSNLPFTQSPADPKLKDVLDALKKDIMLGFNAHHIGTIQSFNAENQTATATINYQKTYYVLQNGVYAPQLVSYPLVTAAPVIVLGGAAGALTFPIQQGDECLLLFNDRDLDSWFAGASGQGNATPRLHSFADAVCLVGLRSLQNSLDNYDAVRVVLRNGTTLVGVGPQLVKIANETYDLGDLLQELISKIQNLITQVGLLTVTGVSSGGSVSGIPVNAPAIALIGASIAATATKIGELIE